MAALQQKQHSAPYIITDISPAKLKLMQKIINANLTKEEITELQSFTVSLISDRQKYRKE